MSIKTAFKTTLGLTLFAVLVLPALVGAAPIPATPQAPETLRAQRASDTSVKLWWKQVKGASGYVVYRANPGSKTFKAVKTLKGQTKSFTLTINLKPTPPIAIR